MKCWNICGRSRCRKKSANTAELPQLLNTALYNRFTILILFTRKLRLLTASLPCLEPSEVAQFISRQPCNAPLLTPALIWASIEAMEIFAYVMGTAFVLFWIVLLIKFISVVAAKKEAKEDEQ